MQPPKIKNFSKHLFWDVNPEQLDMDKNKQFIIQRVLEYGLFEDWTIIYKYYGIDVIFYSIKDIRDLDKKAASFIASLAGKKNEDFLCYTTKQSTTMFWDF
ncbi:MAG: hypothetical protein L3J74_17145 [Bacteroidales bacterium]|nr:hypothetical protein [Bacteroidales bacterium]